VLVLTGADVESVLDMDRLIDAMAAALSDLSGGRVSMPDRAGAFVDPTAGLLDMPSYVPSTQSLVTKLLTFFPANSGTALPVRQAVMVAFDPDTGEPAALVNATALTAARTAACSALSARLLARADATIAAIAGTGAQARAHARAIVRVRPITELRVISRSPDRAEAFAAELGRELPVEVVAAKDAAAGLDGADIICAATFAEDPVVRREWIAPGTHISSVGFNLRGREVDDATVAEALLFVEHRHSALHAAMPNMDLAQPISTGVITAEHIRGELGELVEGTVAGRTDDSQITLYKSVGVAVEDAAAATVILEAARAQGVGQQVDL
jgi:ornithine cyclodeaminase/alanine dehydrogenase-like protein (mu-crystallin family)